MRIDALNTVSQVYKANASYKTKKSYSEYSQDRLEISQSGKDYQVAKAAVNAAPDVREDLVADIKARMKNGTYNISNEALADKLVSRFEELI